MKNIIEQLFSKARKERLDAEKKQAIRGAVLAFMKENPYALSPKPSLFARIYRFKPAYIAMAALLLVVFAGGVSVQADSALPGDALYPVKVGFNEPIRMVLSFSDKAKTDLALKLADLRLQEAEKLTLEGKMTQQGQEQIADNLNVQAKKVADDIKKLNKFQKHNDAAQVSSDLEATLKAHGKVLENLNEPKTLDPLIKQIDNTAEQVSDTVSVVPQQNANLKAIAQSRLQIAQNAIDQANNFIANKKDKTSPEAVSQTQENLNLANQYFKEGQDKMNGDNKDLGSAIILFQQATVVAKESVNLVNINRRMRGW